MKCNCNICRKEFRNIKAMTNHRRWHRLKRYKKFQDKYVQQVKAFNLQERNGMWKGEDIKRKGNAGLHQWIKRRKPKPKICECCNKKEPYDLANISQEYKRDLNDWEWLCRSCHMKKDGRLVKLHSNNIKR